MSHDVLPGFELREGDAEPGEAPTSASLPAADGGRAAWLFLLGSYLIETLLWGKQSLFSWKTGCV